MNSYISGLAYSPKAGLYYSTDNGVGIINENSCFALLSCIKPEIFIRGETLYVLFTKTMGVLSFDNIGDLKRFNKQMEEVPAYSTTEVKPEMVRFFEGPANAPSLNDRKYAIAFDRDTTRFIYAELGLDNLLYQKQATKQLVVMTLKNDRGNYDETKSLLFNFETNIPSLIGWAPFGSGERDFFYPGNYTLSTFVNNIKIDEQTIKVSGKVTIIEAAAHLDSLKIRELIQKGTDVNYKDVMGRSALMYIAKGGDLVSAKILIDHGADVNARDNSGDSPLLVACNSFYKTKSTILYLLDHGADVNAIDKEGNTPLLNESGNIYRDYEVIKMLLEKGADINIKNAKGKRVIMECNDVPTLEMLLKKGADPNYKDDEYGSLSFYFAQLGKYDCLKVLLENGCNPNIIEKNIWNPDKEHSLFWVALQTYSLNILIKNPDQNKEVLEFIDFLYKKGGELTADEENQIMKKENMVPLWKPLPPQMIYGILENNDEAVEQIDTKDTVIQKLIIKRLMIMALGEIMKATSNYEYHMALDLCLKAKEKGEQYKLMDMIPEVYYDMGLISINLEETYNAIQYLKNYLEVAPDGPQASKAKSLLRKIS